MKENNKLSYTTNLHENYTIVDNDLTNKINDLVSVLDLQIRLAFEPFEHGMDAIHEPIDLDKNISRRFEAKIDYPSSKWMSKYDENKTSFITIAKIKRSINDWFRTGQKTE